MMSSAGKDMSSEPRYTIEQISLLHRLLRTGLTKDDIIHALDAMSKMDAEFCSSSPPLMRSHTTGYVSTKGATPTSSINMAVRRGARDGGEISVQEVEGGANGGGMQGAGLLHGMSQEVICGVENFQNVSEEEVDLLFHREPMAVKSEIRTFLDKYRLTQNQISTATGISQSYISAFLINSCLMKRSTQELLYRWYLGKKKELEDLGVQPDFEPLDSSQLIPRSMELYSSPNDDSCLHSVKRRERFTWKESHVRILENYYSKNPYPNDIEREKITEACNNEQKQSGEMIPDSKWVTSSKVYNWFANRRKDANRRKRLGQRIGSDGDMNHTYFDHTHYTSTSPQDVQVIEVRQNDGEHHETGNALTGPEVHVVELQMDSDQSLQDRKPSEDNCIVQQTASTTSETKPYRSMNTIYTLIEAVEESKTSKNL